MKNRSCLKCGRPIPGMGVWLIVNGEFLPLPTKDNDVFCINCGNNGGNAISAVEYQALIRQRDIRNEVNWDLTYSGSYVLIRYGAVSSFIAFREITSSKWRLSSYQNTNENQSVLTLMGEFDHLHECHTAAIEWMQEQYADGHKV